MPYGFIKVRFRVPHVLTFLSVSHAAINLRDAAEPNLFRELEIHYIIPASLTRSYRSPPRTAYSFNDMDNATLSIPPDIVAT